MGGCTMSRGKLSTCLGLLLILMTMAVPTIAGTLEEIKHRNVFKICVNRHALPFSSSDGPMPGAHVEMAQLVARELGVSLDFSWVTFRHRAKYNQCDAFMGVAVLGDGEGFVKKTQPYLNVKMYVVSKPGLQISRLEDLDGLKVATPSASLAHTVLVKRPEVQLFVSMVEDHQMLDAVVNGTVDAAVVANTGIGWYEKTHPGVEFSLTSAEFIHTFNGYPMGIGLRKSDQAMVERANEILAKLTKSGELEEIFKKYGIDKK
ncbi:MAG: transporter substrate-binding domain-containing protein [Gammaproteobacteria bacterium]|nr:MAG: transporter substrate-binding domain-containing protein [Gammaproteobacteria bacterium]